MDSRYVGNRRERPQAPLLPADTGREEEAVAAPARVGGAFSCFAAAHEGGECLIGTNWSATTSPALRLIPARKKKCMSNLRPTWRNRTKLCSKRTYLNRQRLAPLFFKSRTGKICS